MQRFEYKVVPAPRKGEKARGLKSTEDRFAHALSRLMNEMAREGWDYQRTDTLPVEERAGLTGTRTVFQNMLVFRKELTAAAPAHVPVQVAAPAVLAAPPMAAPALAPAPELSAPQPAAPLQKAAPAAAPSSGPEADLLDLAAKRAALFAQTSTGTAPKLSIDASGSTAPSLGPAKTPAP